MSESVGLLLCQGKNHVNFPSYFNSLAEIDLEPFTVEITTQSSPFALSLARHLRSVGAKMYGAFWCSHCVEQKQVILSL